MWTIIIILILVGLLLLILEVIVIPGAGFAGVIGFALMAVAIWLSYTNEGLLSGNITLGVTLAINVLGLVLALRSKTWKNAMLKAVNSGKVNTINEDKVKVGDIGITISRCAPMGKVNFNNVYYEVSTLSEFIDQEQKVEILRISGNKIYIKKTKN